MLVAQGKVRHALFFAHLALEKMLKACVCHATRDLPPRIHKLVRLAERAGLELGDDVRDLLAEMDAFQLEGQYPEPPRALPHAGKAGQLAVRVREVFEWLKKRL